MVVVDICVYVLVYGLFLSIVMIAAPMMTNTTMMTTPMPMTYICVGAMLSGAAVGAVVADVAALA